MKTDMKSRLNAFIEKNKHAFLLLYFCIYFPWFHHLERTVTTHFHVIHTALDDRIPFCEYFIVPYLLWFGYVAWAVGYFYFKNKDEYFKLCAMLFTGMTAVAKNQFGNGTVYYVGTDLSESGLAKVLDLAVKGTAVRPVIAEETALEITRRQADGEDLYFVINFKDEEIPLPAVFDGKEDILTGGKVQGGEMLKKYDLRIVSVPRA